MNRRSFLRFLAAIPLIRHVPLPARLLYGNGTDGDIVLAESGWMSPYKAMSMGGGGGGAAGGLIVIFKGTATVSAAGGKSRVTED